MERAPTPIPKLDFDKNARRFNCTFRSWIIFDIGFILEKLMFNLGLSNVTLGTMRFYDKNLSTKEVENIIGKIDKQISDWDFEMGSGSSRELRKMGFN